MAISTGATSESRALAVVGDQEEDEDDGDADREAGPVKRPAGTAEVCAGAQPIACAQISGEIAKAAGHQGHEGLGPGTPGGFDTFIEIDLRGDKNEGEGKAVQSDSREEPRFSVKCAENEAQNAEGETSGKDPFETPSDEQAGEAEHGDDFGDLAEGHQSGGVLKAELLKLGWRVGIKRCNRNAEQSYGKKDNAVVVVLE